MTLGRAVGYFLDDDWHGKANSIVASVTPGPKLYKKGSWVSGEEQDSKQYSSMASASVRALGSFPEFPFWWTELYADRNAFLPKLFMVYGV